MPRFPCRARVAQLPLFPRPSRIPHWNDLPRDIQEKNLRLLAQLLRRHGAGQVAARQRQEGCDE